MPQNAMVAATAKPCTPSNCNPPMVTPAGASLVAVSGPKANQPVAKVPTMPPIPCTPKASRLSS